MIYDVEFSLDAASELLRIAEVVGLLRAFFLIDVESMVVEITDVRIL